MKPFGYLFVLGAGLAIIGAGFAVLMLTSPNNSFANLVYTRRAALSETRFGNATSVLTMHVTGNKIMKSGFKSGCVGVNHSGRLVIGSSVRQGNNPGGDEKPPAHFLHNLTPTVSNTSQMAIIFSSDQRHKNEGSIALDNLMMALYNFSGKPSLVSGNLMASIELPDLSSGLEIGKSGRASGLSAVEGTQAHAAIDAGFNILGLSATASHTRGGPETLFREPEESLVLSDSPAPEPASLLLFGVGLLSLAGLVRLHSRSVKRKLTKTDYDDSRSSLLRCTAESDP
ncbi:MAG TPA: PEP-CTERM sorting domain-containing protein [Terriglobia bacterium]|nr:PEP-CTERM sorting domain-containing protein [Terriglobia bacterium]